jgi:glutamine synthetase
MSSSRFVCIREIASRNAITSDAPRPARTSEYFGINTFGAKQMRDKLPADVYAKLVDAVRYGRKLDPEVAPVVAQVVKDWAVGHGATHFTHWFQPQTGLTAEKHDAFIEFDGENVLETFTADQLIQSEPDASSFPSGGLRATWEARGYTAWNPASPLFIAEWAGVQTLCIPSVFIGYTGEALDEMTPLLRSSDVLSERAVALLDLIGDEDIQRVFTTLGPEQEYFLVDRTLSAMRPDLIMANRTVIGAPPARGQQLEDHYFGGIPERVQSCIAEVEYELYKLGVPIRTRHNEVAPSQFEMAPVFEETDVAVDHNQLVMATLRRVALRHGLQALLHEKPFAGVNGSGKHCNWSLQIRSEDHHLDGSNLLKPGDTPHQNVRFLLFLAAILKAVHKHAGALRASIASSGNEYRLGANEAPPAIISVFMGGMLTGMLDEITSGKVRGSAEEQMLRLGVAKLPEIKRDNTDRNRTSPFAFTGQKFEFRAVGGSQSIAFPIMVLNAAVAEALGELTEQLREKLNGSKKADDAVLAVVRESFAESAPIRFEGNNYSQEWVEEAERRGLPNLKRAPEALAQLVTPQSRALFNRLGILSEDELESRYHVKLERYSKDILIELNVLREMVDTMVLPTAFQYLGVLTRAAADARTAGISVAPQAAAAEELGRLVEDLRARRGGLDQVIRDAAEIQDPQGQADFLSEQRARCLEDVRALCDQIELTVPDVLWPLPKYREMLFPV